MGEEIRVGNDDPALIVGLDDGRASLNFLHRSFVRIQLDLVSHPEGLRPQKKQAGEEVLQYVLKRETNRNTPDTQDLDEIGHLEGGGNDGDSYQEAEQYRSAAGQSRKNKRKILTPL